MSTPRLTLLLAAVILTMASVAALIIGLVTGVVSPGTAVVGLMLCTTATWLCWAISGRFERLAERQRVDATLGRLDGDQPQTRSVRPVR